MMALLYDHREAPADTDMSDRQSLIDGLRVAYGDSSGHPGGCVLHSPICPPGHVDLDRLVATIWDPGPGRPAVPFGLPQSDHPRLGFVGVTTGVGRLHGPDDKIIDEKDAIVSRVRRVPGPQPGQGRRHRLSAAGCQMGTCSRCGCGSSPPAPLGRTGHPTRWRWTRLSVTASQRWRVVGFYADPSGWTEHVAKWEAQYHRKPAGESHSERTRSRCGPAARRRASPRWWNSCGPRSPTVNAPTMVRRH